jgi:hypothetical protein
MKQSTISIKLDNCKNTNDRYDLQTIELDENLNYKAGLTYFSGWNNIPNITEANNVFRYSSDNGATWKEIKLITGAYEIADIAKELMRHQNINGDYISGKSIDYPLEFDVFKMGSRVVLKINAANYVVDFLTIENSLRDLLGFNKTMYQKGYHIAENICNISHIQTIHIDCNIIKSNHIVNGSKKILRPVIYSFPAYAIPTAARIVEKPSSPKMYNVITKTIDSICIRIYDDDGKDINFNGEPFSLEIIIEEVH